MSTAAIAAIVTGPRRQYEDAVQELPGVLDPVRVLADQQLRDVLLQVRGDGQLAAVQGGVTDAGHAVLRGDPQGHEVPGGAGHEDFSGNDFHGSSFQDGLVWVA